MTREQIDQRTGTILFVEDEDTQNIKYLLQEVAELKRKNIELENRIRFLEDKNKEDS